MFEGRRNVVTPSCSVQRRMWSPGISLKIRCFSRGFQMGPSVKSNPEPSSSSSTSSPTTSRKRGSRISTLISLFPDLLDALVADEPFRVGDFLDYDPYQVFRDPGLFTDRVDHAAGDG